MASAPLSRPSSSFLQPPSSEAPPRPPKSARRPRTSIASPPNHYRPFSSLSIHEVSDLLEPTAVPSSPKRNRRPTSSSGFLAMGLLRPSLGVKGASESHSSTRPISPSPLSKRPQKKSSMGSVSVLSSKSETPTIRPTPAHSLSTPNPHASPSSPPSTPRPRFEFDGGDQDDFGLTYVPSPTTDSHDTEYVPKDIWAFTENRAKLHPYQNDAPYPQSYDSVCLANDRYFDVLLRRLNPTPSFHDYGNKPPSTVLDLGCGPGHWALGAARAWEKSAITCFDMVDVTLPEVHSQPNLKFVRGNFVKFALPFPDQSFDMVRMCGLTLCIPQHAMAFVISEVDRVLRVGGRVETIDDQLLYTYGKEPKPPRRQRQSSEPGTPDVRRSLGSGFFGDSDDEYSDYENGYNEKPPSHKSSFGPVSISRSSSSSSDDHGVLREPVHSPLSPLSSSPPLDTTSETSWIDEREAAADMETMFEVMANNHLNMSSTPHRLFVRALDDVYGSGNSGQLKSFHLKIAPIELAPSQDEAETRKRNWRGKMVEKKSKIKDIIAEETIPTSVVPGTISAKAAGRLGISPSELSNMPFAEKPTSRQGSTPSLSSSVSTSTVSLTATVQQSPGLLIWPNTFIPMPADELEMHVCRHIHTLLSCKSALLDYLSGLRDESGEPYLTKQEISDRLWDYECFRRRRYNWPAESTEGPLPPPIEFLSSSSKAKPKTPDDIKKEHPGHSPLHQVAISTSYDENDLIHVRSIRVYEGTKTRHHGHHVLTTRPQ